MSSPPEPRTFEGLIEEEWGSRATTPDVMALLEPYRESVTYLLDDFDDENQSWRSYCGAIFGYGPGDDNDGAIPSAVQRAVEEMVRSPLPEKKDPLDELCALIESAGGRMTFDSRRYAKAAAEWPDHLPPMFAAESRVVETWGKTAKWNMWTARPAADWPAPTVFVGQVFEQKSALIASWEAAAAEVGIYKNGRYEVRAIQGEHFVTDKGFTLPWLWFIPGPHIRPISPLVPGAWTCGEPVPSSLGYQLHSRRFTSTVTGLCAAEAWRPVEVRDQWEAEWTWHTWDVDGIGGENASSTSYDQMVKDVAAALDRQAKRRPTQWHMFPVEEDGDEAIDE